MNERIRFLDCPLDLLGHDALLARAEHALASDDRLRIEGLNVAKLVEAREQPALRQALAEAELVHVDGAGISLGLAALGLPVPPRRAGIDLMGDLCAMAARLDQPVYLLGAREAVVRAAGTALAQRYPGLRLAGMRDGYFDAAQEAEVVAAIRASGARLLFIGISSPKKELFVARHWDALGVGIAMGVGGAFDVVSGQIPRAPRWMQRLALEWLFRLIQEPRRLLWRYLRTNTRYLLWLAAACLAKRR